MCRDVSYDYISGIFISLNLTIPLLNEESASDLIPKSACYHPLWNLFKNHATAIKVTNRNALTFPRGLQVNMGMTDIIH